jgi:pyruvate dehydrogenase E2 component (dihydrolipoamide acetyltransferase)
VAAGEVAKVGAVVAVIAGEGGASANAPVRLRRAPQLLRRTRQGLSSGRPRESGDPVLDQRTGAPAFAGASGRGSAASFAYPDLDPFFEVRTPSRNFGPAQLGRRRGCDAAGAPARRRERHRPFAGFRLGPARAHRRGRRRGGAFERRRAGGRRQRRLGECPPIRSRRSIKDVAYEEVPLDGMRKTIARRLVEAKQTIPHFYLTADVTMDAALKLREEANAAARQSRRRAGLQAVGQRLRHQGAGAGAAARAGGQRGLGRRPHPALQAIRRRVAVAIEGGLLTPVIRNAEASRCRDFRAR